MQPVLKSSILVHYAVMSYLPWTVPIITSVLFYCHVNTANVYNDTVYHHSTVVQVETELHNAWFFFALCFFSLHSIHRLVTDNRQVVYQPVFMELT